ncbi:hypothetical protein HYFRA_00011966 [Hymenoscyphus fraxineus]|uniref:Uncharacterized protein n=1 Tax=Hymenoscyphus fraxineus TaxID=746836 RepID=A0A9N9L2R6_9HELO|nr:hypothetical protein HYFRA_00011966 [Hymenoscyphus fraxineus]
MHFINISTGLLLLNAIISITAIPLQLQDVALEARTLPVNTVPKRDLEPRARPLNFDAMREQIAMFERFKMESIQGNNYWKAIRHWDREIARVKADLALEKKPNGHPAPLPSKRGLEARAPPSTYAEVKSHIEYMRTRKAIAKNQKQGEAAVQYWKGEIQSMKAKLKEMDPPDAHPASLPRKR